MDKKTKNYVTILSVGEALEIKTSDGVIKICMGERTKKANLVIKHDSNSKIVKTKDDLYGSTIKN